MTLVEAMALFSRIGFDGIEIRCAPDGQIDTERFDLDDAPVVRELAAAAGLEIVCLTPYFRNFIDPAKRESELAAMRKVIDIAAAIGCPNVRCYGGLEPPTPDEHAYYWERTRSGLKEIGLYAADRGVGICIETHGGSLTMSVRDTVRMVEEVGLANVGILFDYPWVSLAGLEGPEDSVELAAPYIRHVHVKDWVVDDAGTRATTLFGEGQLEWERVLRALVASGYDGYLSDEYEKYWKAYLPGPETGMAQDLAVLRRMLQAIREEAAR